MNIFAPGAHHMNYSGLCREYLSKDEIRRKKHAAIKKKADKKTKHKAYWLSSNPYYIMSAF